MVARIVRVPRMIAEEFGGWRAFFRGQGIWHGLVWLAYDVIG